MRFNYLMKTCLRNYGKFAGCAIVAYACSPHIWEAEAGGSWIPGQLGLHRAGWVTIVLRRSLAPLPVLAGPLNLASKVLPAQGVWAFTCV